MAEFGGGAGGGGRGDVGDRAREEFFSEAQEIVDGLSRDLLALDGLAKSGRTDAELVNDVFRAVHTLKGLSGLFGATMMSGLSHELEDLLDDLRLGRIELTAQVLDLLFKAVDLYGRILSSVKGDAPEPAAEVKQLLIALGAVAQQREGGGRPAIAQYELDPALLGVLTEYEEHRLRTNIQAGLFLYRIRVQFSLATIDSALDDLKARARPHGEIITYLPTGAGGDVDAIELEILIASNHPISALRAALAGPNVSIDEVAKTGGGSSDFPSLPAPPPPGQKIDENSLFRSNEPLTASSLPPGSVSPLLERAGIAPQTAKGTQEPPLVSPVHAHTAHAAHPGAGTAVVVAAAPQAREMSLRSVSQTVRVDIRKLDHLMNIVGELAIVRSSFARMAERVRSDPRMRELGTDLQRLHRAFDRHLLQMQNGILEVRMVPLGQAFDKLARIVRQISREHDKQVNLVVTGAETEIDKLIVEELSDPLMHMMRNALDHAIEDRDERSRVGKPPVGTVALNAFQKGNHVLIEVEDDGRGMDPKELVAAALKRGLVPGGDDLGPKEALQLIFLPGFTTKDDVTDLSGRGVGMDIVKTNIAKLGGIVDITSEIGIGTKITITLPVTLAIISVLAMEVAGRTYCVPLSSIEEAITLDEAAVRVVEGREVMTVRGGTLPICRLARLFGHLPAPPGPRAYVVIAQVGDRRLGFVVDKLLGQQDIVLKALGKSLRHVRGFAGATELGDQRVGLVIDAAALIEEVLAAASDTRMFGGMDGLA
jgi:two-component system chemotaxis sensor kinase CheA